MNKKLFICGAFACATTLAIPLVLAGTKLSLLAKAGLDTYKLDLVQELQGKTVVDGAVSFEKNGYSFNFLVSGLTISSGSLSLADGGYIKNATAFNGLNNIALNGTYSNAFLSTGTLSGLAVLKNEDRAVPTSANDISDGDTHFRLDAEGGSVSLSKLELSYSCGSTVETDASSSWDLMWDFHGKGTEASPLLINSLADWNRFATYSQTEKFSGKYIALTTDIDASAVSNSLMLAFESDNSDSSNHKFDGHFDGRNHTITYNVTATDARKGLFCRLGNCTVENLILDGSLTGPDVLGTLTGESIGDAIVKNVISSVDITATSNATSTGGIVGLNNLESSGQLLIDGCEYSGTVNSVLYENVGGILGNVNRSTANTTILNCVNRSSFSATKAGVGGIIGRCMAGPNLVIRNCVNAVGGDLSSALDCVGGIVGKALTTTIIDNCVNQGNVNVTNTGISSAGGIIGYTENNSHTYTITNCENDGNITGSRFVGGIIGRDETTSGDVLVNQCVNTGTITATHTNAGAKAAGIIGGSANGSAAKHTTVSECLNFGLITSGNTNANSGALVGGIVGSTSNFVEVLKCENYGEVFSKGGCVGGITGEMLRAAKLENCANYGTVTGNERRVGGISGTITDGGKLRYCTNYGNVTGKGVQAGGVGGITGIYFPITYTASGVNYSTEFNHNINHGNVNSTASFAGGLVGKYGSSTNAGSISNSVNYGNVSSTNNVHGGIVGSDAGSGTSGLALSIVNSVSYGTSNGATDNLAVGKAHLAALTSSLVSGSTLTLEVALKPNSWTLGSGESYCAIVSKGGSETFVSLTKSGALYKYNVDLSLYDNIEFAVLNSGMTISDGRDGVKLSTPTLRLGSGSVYSIDSVSTEATGHWTEVSKAMTISIDATKWDAGDGYFAAQCLGGINEEKWYQMDYDSENNVYTCDIDVGVYDKVRFVLMNNGASLTQNESTNLANSSKKSAFVGAYANKALCYSKLGENSGDVIGVWVEA